MIHEMCCKCSNMTRKLHQLLVHSSWTSLPTTIQSNVLSKSTYESCWTSSTIFLNMRSTFATIFVQNIIETFYWSYFTMQYFMKSLQSTAISEWPPAKIQKSLSFYSSLFLLLRTYDFFTQWILWEGCSKFPVWLIGETFLSYFSEISG